MHFGSTIGLVIGLFAAAAVGGCVTAIGISPDGTGGSGGGRSSVNGSGPQAGSGGAGALCIPPAVQAVLATCTTCHSDPPIKGVPDGLATVADLQASSPLGGTMADRCVTRMKDSALPMPPDGLLSSAQVATFQTWVQGGMSLVECPSTTSGAGNGSGSGAGNGAVTSAAGGTTSANTSAAATTSSGGGGPPPNCADANDTIGCCDTSGVLYYCTNGSLTSQTCTGTSVCGWNTTAGYYDCVATGGSDPSGTYPKACGGGTSSSTSSSSASTTGGGGGVTWTTIYNGVFGPTGTSGCAGGSCHTNSKSGFKCGTSKTTCYNGFVSAGLVSPGANASSSAIADPNQSPICGATLGGNMPIGNSCITNAELAEIQSWLAAGAADN